jgi:hypothetical protein
MIYLYKETHLPKSYNFAIILKTKYKYSPLTYCFTLYIYIYICSN